MDKKWSPPRNDALELCSSSADMTCASLRVVVGHEILRGEFHCEKHERVVRQIAGPETRVLSVEKPTKPGLVPTMVHVPGDAQTLKLGAYQSY